MLLTDITIEHTKRASKGVPTQHFVMHPFESSSGSDAGTFEILRDIKEPDHKKVKRSVHVTTLQLAELYAKGVIEKFDILLRLRPNQGKYPSAPPGKKVPVSCITPGSSFDRLMRGFDKSAPVNAELKQILLRMNVKL